jgi:hypothetical protein
MFDPDLWLVFLVKIIAQYATLMTGGVIILGLLLLERWRRKPVPRKIFAVLAAVILVLAFYNVWRDEYIKSAGNVTINIMWNEP